MRRIALVPAHNEEGTVAGVIEEIKGFDPDFDVLVIDDGSTDRTAAVAEAAGARVVQLPYNLGIGGAVQTGLQYARDHDFDVAVQVDGDAQHDPAEIPKILAPIIEGDADLVVGSRFLGEGEYEPPVTRLLGIRFLARVVSLLVRQRVTDTTSGFRASNRRAISLFASDYPHDYPEVEAMVLVFRHRLKLVEVPVQMRLRGAGESSITFWRSAYYMLKVLLALFVGLFRRYPTPQEDHQ
ncbi:MAG: glycosyltransferase family 2 protein [Actinomycetota bacterium]|nr:glycosyltransferase family 2 protein [Actinomycetota bacterium]